MSLSTICSSAKPGKSHLAESGVVPNSPAAPVPPAPSAETSHPVPEGRPSNASVGAPPTQNVYRDLGALAQAARNYLVDATPHNATVLDRLAAEVLGANRLCFVCLDCGALVATDEACDHCGLGR